MRLPNRRENRSGRIRRPGEKSQRLTMRTVTVNFLESGNIIFQLSSLQNIITIFLAGDVLKGSCLANPNKEEGE